MEQAMLLSRMNPIDRDETYLLLIKWTASAFPFADIVEKNLMASGIHWFPPSRLITLMLHPISLGGRAAAA
jgi:hypothetical protein